MTEADQVDQFFALLEDEDVDFVGDSVGGKTQTHSDVPVLSYRWCKNETVAQVPLKELMKTSKQVMEDLGLCRVVSKGHHLRGDTANQRVKMTVLRSGGSSMYLLMTAGMPGKREQAKHLNQEIAQRVEERIRLKHSKQRSQRKGPTE